MAGMGEWRMDWMGEWNGTGEWRVDWMGEWMEWESGLDG